MKTTKLSSKRNSEAGFSLIEMIMALTISLIGLIGGLTLYRSAHEATNAGQEAMEIQAGVRKALEIIAKELHESNVDTIDVTVSNAVSFASARSNGTFVSNSDGTPDWQNAVVYFVDTTSNTLCRVVQAKDDWSSGFDTASALTSEDIEQLVPNVESMTCTLTDNVLNITFAFSKHIESEDNDVYTSQVLIRN